MYIDWNNVVANAAGAFVGAFIILAIDHLYVRCSERRRFKKSRVAALNALSEETHGNLRICDHIITTLGADGIHHSVFSFARFEKNWVLTIENEFIDFLDPETAVRQRSILYGVRSLMSQIHDSENTLNALHTNSRANANFTDLAYAQNQAILGQAKELKIILEVAKKEFLPR